MTESFISTKDLEGLRVLGAKPSKKDPDAMRKIGKVRACVFHPHEKRFVGVLVKRPDAAMMFHRKDLFVAYNGYDLLGNYLVVHDDPQATDGSACRVLGIDWDSCVLWVGMPVVTQGGATLGGVGNVTFDGSTGVVRSLEVTAGATANALLGTREIPASLIRGFRQGIGQQLTTFDEEGEERMLGAILVDDAAEAIAVEGGLAEKAGEATAIAGNKAQEAVDNVVKPAADAAGKAVNKGAYVTGRQLVRAKGMFSGFKDEYDKATGKASDGKLTMSAGDDLSEQDEDYEIVYVDEDGNVIEDDCEVVYVDEDGNIIEEQDVEYEIVYVDEDDDVVVNAGKSDERPTASTKDAARAVGAHLKKAGGMFSSFKDEFDKAKR